MSDDKAKLTKRLDRLAEVLTETTLSQYAHTVYEASAELDGQAARIAMLREAVDGFIQCDLSFVSAPIEWLESEDQTGLVPIVLKAKKALAATAADVEAWQAELAAIAKQELKNVD